MATHPRVWNTCQNDVKHAFLNGELKKEVYVEQLQGYEEGEGQVLHLKMTLYGLKQSRGEWHVVLFQELEVIGLRRSTFDSSVFFNKTNALNIAGFVVDLGINLCDKKDDKRVAEHLAKEFRITDLAEVGWVVGVGTPATHGSMGASRCRIAAPLARDLRTMA